MRIMVQIVGNAWKKWRTYASHNVSHGWWACSRTKSHQSKSHNMSCLYPQQTMQTKSKKPSWLKNIYICNKNLIKVKESQHQEWWLAKK